MRYVGSIRQEPQGWLTDKTWSRSGQHALRGVHIMIPQVRPQSCIGPCQVSCTLGGCIGVFIVEQLDEFVTLYLSFSADITMFDEPPVDLAIGPTSVDGIKGRAVVIFDELDVLHACVRVSTRTNYARVAIPSRVVAGRQSL